MKWLSILFAIYILTLSAMPCCDKDCCNNEMTQNTDSSHKSEVPCSPFFMCNSCHGFVIPESGIKINEAETITTATVQPILNLHLSDFHNPAWQPPRAC